MKFSIEPTQPHLASTWFQIMLTVGELTVPIRDAFPAYGDAVTAAEQLVIEFVTEGVNVEHSEIYNLMNSGVDTTS